VALKIQFPLTAILIEQIKKVKSAKRETSNNFGNSNEETNLGQKTIGSKIIPKTIKTLSIFSILLL